MDLVLVKTVRIIDGQQVMDWVQAEFGRFVGMACEGAVDMQGESCWCVWSVQLDQYTCTHDVADVLDTLQFQVSRHGEVELMDVLEYLYHIGEIDPGMYTFYAEW